MNKLIIVFYFVIVINCSMTIVKSAKMKKDVKIHYCNTKSCNSTATEIIDNMYEKVDPCNNFYDFACGAFFRTYEFPDHSINNALEGSSFTARKTMFHNISELPTSNNQVFNMLKMYYKKCRNFNDNTLPSYSDEGEYGDEELLKILKKLGGWPVLMPFKWIEINFNWSDALATIIRLNFPEDILMKFYIDIDPRDNIKRIHIGQGQLGLKKQYLEEGIDNQFVQDYYESILGTANFIGGNITYIILECLKVTLFEIKLAKIISLSNERVMTINELQSEYPIVNWLNYLNKIVEPRVLNETEKVVVVTPDYFAKLQELLKTTPNRTLSNYILWRVSKQSAKYLNPRARLHDKSNTEYLTGKFAEDDWKNCVKRGLPTFSYALNAYYVKNFVNTTNKRIIKEVENMFKNIRYSVKHVIQESTLLDNSSKNLAIDKLMNMKFEIGYSMKHLDDSYLNDYYKNLKITNGTLFKMVLEMNKFSMENALKSLHTKPVQGEWIGNVFDHHVNYNKFLNSMEIPWGVFQNNMYDSKRPAFMNYATLGTLLGREMAHAVLNPNNWFDFDIRSQVVNQKVECFIDQYDNYELLGVRLHGSRTFWENIADNIGLKAAHQAYNSLGAKVGNKYLLPGLERFNRKQIFWLSYANSLCEVIADIESLKQATRVPNYQRVIGALSNFEAFSQDFQCFNTSLMNPSQRCSV